jgi:ribosomal protein S12 methylthiotransferase accessory factor
VAHSAYANLAAIVDSLLDPKVGIVSSLEEVRPEAGAPNFFHYRARAQSTRAFARESNFRDSGGASTSRELAMAKAIGEALERYCPALFDFQELPLFAWQDAPGPAVPPSEFALYSAEQYAEPGFPWLPFLPDTKVRWTQAANMHDGADVYVPACRVFMPYNYYIGTGDTPVDQPISTGLACHQSFIQAAINAFCEVVERDAVMLTWQARLAPPIIRVESLPDALYDVVSRFERTGLSLGMFNITTDNGIPTVLSTLRGQNVLQPALVVAAASSLDPVEAARKSLEELAHTRRYCQWVKSHVPRIRPDPPRFESVTDQLTHLNFFVDHENRHYADFLTGSRQRIDFDEIANHSVDDQEKNLNSIVRRIHDTGDRALIADLTTPDVGDLGLRVVRAIVPGYQPLHMGFQLRARGGQRLYRVPQLLGYRGIHENELDNAAPHPYP